MSRYSILCRSLEFGYEPSRKIISVSSLDILSGEISVFCGGNGTGKTTLMKLMSGLFVPWSGELDYLDEHGRCLSRREIILNSIYVHQEPYIFKGSVHQNLALFLPGMKRQELEFQIHSSLSMAGLEGYEKKRAAALSGGEKKRLALARALSVRKNILFLDEPTANVDARNTGLLVENLMDFRARGMTVVIATHDEEFAARVADIIYDFSGGSLYKKKDFAGRGEKNC